MIDLLVCGHLDAGPVYRLLCEGETERICQECHDEHILICPDLRCAAIGDDR